MFLHTCSSNRCHIFPIICIMYTFAANLWRDQPNKENETASVLSMHAVASKCSRSRFHSEKYKTVQSSTLHFLQNSPLVQLHTSAGDYKVVGNISGSQYESLFRSSESLLIQPTLGYHITNRQSRYITPARLKSAYTTQQVLASSWRWTY